MKIQLKEIPAEGRSYHLSHQTGEINEDLRDLIDAREYDLRFSVQPLADHFEVKGQVSAQLPEVCSRCACDFELPVNEGFKELLVVVPVQERTEKTSRVNHISDLFAEGPLVTELHDFVWNVGEFFHQFLALASPIHPLCNTECKGLCAHCGANLNLESCRCQRQNESKGVEGPFAVLKNLKLN